MGHAGLLRQSLVALAGPARSQRRQDSEIGRRLQTAALVVPRSIRISRFGTGSLSVCGLRCAQVICGMAGLGGGYLVAWE